MTIMRQIVKKYREKKMTNMVLEQAYDRVLIKNIAVLEWTLEKKKEILRV